MITRHVLGLFHGLPGSRRIRQLLSDPKRLAAGSPRVFDEARAILDAACAPRVPVTEPTQSSHT
jgi:tRNA-dihydrouridine synthase A